MKKNCRYLGKVPVSPRSQLLWSEIVAVPPKISIKKKSRRAREKVNRGPPAKNNRKLPLQQREQGLSTFRPKPGLDQRPSSSSSSSEPFTTLPFCHDQIFVTLSTIPFLGAPLESAGTTKTFSILTTNSPSPERSLAPAPPHPLQSSLRERATHSSLFHTYPTLATT